VLLAILLAAAAAPPAATSPLFADEGLSAALGRIDPRAGAWAEYLIRPKGNGNLRLRATALPASGEGRYWLELATASEAGLVSAVRMLLRGTEFSLGSVERMFLLLAGQPPIEIPPEQIARATGRSGAAAKADRLGTERVRVPAGEFTADAIRAGKTRIWRSAAVPLWGLIKALSPRQSMELVASGTSGGRSVFPAGWDQGNGSDSMK
jgi:hypothetical protein